MADSSAAACSFSSASTSGYASTSDYQYHDVFINHRGPDAKDPFATSLYRRLIAKGLQVFLDKPEMQVGHNIRSQIKAAIRVASVHISIFSPRYAESEWCLNELLWMVKTGKPIIPVFYKVKPEHLRWTGTENDGPYAIALRQHEQRHGTETIQRWIKALNDVANICGLELEAFNGQEEELLEKVESTSDSQYHDVFINHRGPDVKETFATSLYRRLTAKGLQDFLDKPEMQVGHNILSQIEAAIRVASVHIAIFSPRYAKSEWCLNELLWMMETGKTIIPVFYKVKPEHLRRTKWTGTEKDGPYAIALRKHEQEQRHGLETIQRWISGLDLEAFNRQEEELLEKVEQSVLKICPPSLDAAKYPTGLRQAGNRGSRNGGIREGRNGGRQRGSEESEEAETEGRFRMDLQKKKRNDSDSQESEEAETAGE